jgi:type IV secretion system protein VirB9
MRLVNFILFSFLYYFFCSSSYSDIERPLTTDKRIRSLIYSPNEVFRIVVKYGFQTMIEFDEKETINSISIGDIYAWDFSEVGNKLIIKPLEDNIFTNMAIISKTASGIERVYHLELISKDIDSIEDDELIYTARFFYPDSEYQPIYNEPYTPQPKEETPVLKPFNFNYKIKPIGKLSNNSELIPTKVFNDETRTYFEFSKKLDEKPIIEDEKGNILSVGTKDKYVFVNSVSKYFIIYIQNQKIKILNEYETIR